MRLAVVFGRGKEGTNTPLHPQDDVSSSSSLDAAAGRTIRFDPFPSHPCLHRIPILHVTFLFSYFPSSSHERARWRRRRRRRRRQQLCSSSFSPSLPSCLLFPPLLGRRRRGEEEDERAGPLSLPLFNSLSLPPLYFWVPLSLLFGVIFSSSSVTFGGLERERSARKIGRILVVVRATISSLSVVKKNKKWP